MDTSLYPSLHETFNDEGVCPICLMEMEMTPKYACVNGHTVCHRCKPYYYACPTCRSPLDVELNTDVTPPYPPVPSHFMPHPMPNFYNPSPNAPPVDDFLMHERGSWEPPAPQEDQELIRCSYADFGCWIRMPANLQELHESRCQFRPSEIDSLPSDLRSRYYDYDGPVECRYRPAGCQVKVVPWRKHVHEKYCEYRESMDALVGLGETLSELSLEQDKTLMECKYRKYGCMVNMPKWRKGLHQEKCNYREYHQEGDTTSEDESSQGEYDPDEKVECRWSEYGCRVQPKRSRKERHEENCNYKMEECAYKDNGCEELIHPSRKIAHHRTCEFAY